MNEPYRFTITGRIGVDCRYSDITGHLLAARLAGKDVHIDIDSPGGDLAEALAINAALRSFDGGTTCHIRCAASAGAVVALGCDHRVMASNGWLLLHPVAAIAMGTVQTILAEASRLTLLDDALAEVVTNASGMPTADARALVAGESWIDAMRSIELGLTHDISGPVDPAPSGPGDGNYTEAGRRQSVARSAITPLSDETRASNCAAYSAVVPSVPAIAPLEPMLEAGTVDELAGGIEIERRRREAIWREARRVSRLSTAAAYRAGPATWTCRSCGAPNTHTPGAGNMPSPCVTCRSTGVIED